jgi:inhibitor of KinA sporulation pathway (predicted exonuclease)
VNPTNLSDLPVIDLEGTCGVQSEERETIEIGAVLGDDGFQTLVCPTRHIITDLCFEVTGITQQDVDSAPMFPEAMSLFLQWLGGRADGFCSWGPYDPWQLKTDCRYHGLDYPFRRHVDLSRLFTRKYGRRRGHRGAMKILGIEPEGCHHRGLDDARNIARMLPCL